MKYKENWEETKQRYNAWWKRENMERPLMFVTAPKNNSSVNKLPEIPATPEERWTNLSYLSALNEYQHQNTFYGGEAFPRWTMGYPGYAAPENFYGSPFSLDFRTGWHDPILDEEKYDLSGLRIDKTNPWWAFCDKVLGHAKKEAKDKSVPSICNIRAGADSLASLRGTEKLYMDMIDYPDMVREATLELFDNWKEIFEHQVELTRSEGTNYTTFFPLWSPKINYVITCDVSYGISVSTFRDCFVPFQRKMAEYLEHSIYHLDGTQSFQHIAEICKIEEVDVIQVLPGAGQPSPLHFLDVCKTVQKSNKNLHITIEPEDVPLALELLDKNGLCIDTRAASEDEARRLIEMGG